jgi:hypothetical protein
MHHPYPATPLLRSPTQTYIVIIIYYQAVFDTRHFVMIFVYIFPTTALRLFLDPVGFKIKDK